MRTIIMRPYDNLKIVEVFIVEHEKPRKDFKKDFDRALEAEKKACPEEGQVDDVLARLEKQGWQILRPENQITVIY